MMVAYSFKRRFVDPIKVGTKRQTIRAERKRHARVGEELQLYTGMRTRECQLIGRVECLSVWPITLNFVDYGVIKIGDTVLFSDARMQEFARSDGFDSWADMRAFWRENHRGVDSFDGVLIRWGDLNA